MFRLPTPAKSSSCASNGLEIRRIALIRTVFYTNAGEGNYWAAPRAAISNDGSTVAADSNFGQIGKPRVTLDRDRLRLQTQLIANVTLTAALLARCIDCPAGGHRVASDKPYAA